MATKRKPNPSIGGIRKSPKQKAKELAIAQRRVKAAELRLAGNSERQIAEALGISCTTAHTDLEAILQGAREDAWKLVEKEKTVSLARLECAVKALWPDVEKGDLE